MFRLLEKYKGYVKGKSGAVNLMMAQTLTTILMFVVDIIFARLFSKEIFGSWKQILLVVNLLIPFLTFGSVEGFKYYSALEIDKWKRHFTNVSLFIFLIAIVLSASMWVFGIDMLIEFFGNSDLAKAALILPFTFLFFALGNLLRNASINIDRTIEFRNATILGLIISALCYLYAIFNHTSFDAQVLVLYLTVGFTLIHLVKVIFLFGAIRPVLFDLKFSLSDYGGYMKYGIPLYLTSFITIITLNIDKTIVSFYEGTSVFAVYSIGAKEIPLIGIVSASIYQNSFPKLVQYFKDGLPEKAYQLWLDSTAKVSYYIYPVILVLMLFSKPLIELLYGTGYTDSVRIFQTYLLILLWRNNYYGALLSSSGRTKWITFYGLITMIINVVASILLYQAFGIIGVVYATVLAVSIANVLQLAHEQLLLDFVKVFLKNKLLLLLQLAVIASYFLT